MSAGPDLPRWRGLIPYLPTPVDDHGRLRAGVLREIVAHVLAADVGALCPLGSTGEAALLDDRARDEVLRETIDAAGDTPVIAGVTGTGLAPVLEQVRRARGHGAAGVLLALRAYFPLTDAEVFRAIERVVAAAAPLPLVLYLHPEWCGVTLRPSDARRLVSTGVAGLKEASPGADPGSWLSVAPDLVVYAATASDPVLALERGAVGLMSGPGVVLPAELAAVAALVTAQRLDEARALADQLMPVLDVFRGLGAARAVKALCRARGFDVGDPVPPQAPLTPDQLDEAARALQAAEPGVAPAGPARRVVD